MKTTRTKRKTTKRRTAPTNRRSCASRAFRFSRECLFLAGREFAAILPRAARALPLTNKELVGKALAPFLLILLLWTYCSSLTFVRAGTSGTRASGSHLSRGDAASSFARSSEDAPVGWRGQRSCILRQLRDNASFAADSIGVLSSPVPPCHRDVGLRRMPMPKRQQLRAAWRGHLAALRIRDLRTARE
jgi:hypothetical protein